MKTLRIILAVLLLPLAASLTIELFHVSIHLARTITVQAVPFWLGLGGYFLFQVFFRRPVGVYVFGHELTHALAGLMSGARLKSFKVASDGGSVLLSKTNIWISLAPYFVPLYTLLVLGIYWGAAQFWDVTPYYPWCLFAAGFTLSFHIGLTRYALAQGQSDLKIYGPFFSGVVIVVINCLILIVIAKCLFPQSVALRGYLLETLQRTGSLFGSFYDSGMCVWHYFRRTN